MWSSIGGFDGHVTWITEKMDTPAECVCGALLQVTEYAHKDERPIELRCDRGHRWRETSILLDEAIRRHGGGS